jgi:hypothetical protein
MACPVIKFPTAANPVIGGAFIASGFAEDGFIGVAGKLVNKVTTKATDGKTLEFRQLNMKKHKKQKGYHWVIGFRDIDPGDYTLTVTAHDAQGATCPTTANGIIKVQKAVPTDKVAQPDVVVITSPPDNTTDIGSDLCGGTFEPGGVLTNGSELDPNSVTLIFGDGTSPDQDIMADYAFSYDIWWWALFPEISREAPQMFTLHAAPVLGTGVSELTGLRATFPCTS